MPVSGELIVVLVSTRNPLNIGAAARAMSNFGFTRLRVVNPYDVAFREARSAVGAAELLASAKSFASVADAVADCHLVVGTTAGTNRELDHPIRTLPFGGGLIRKQLVSGNVALLFGSEKRGLSNDDLAHCHWLLQIPTREAHPSMNLGQAVAVCLYELARDPKIRVETALTPRATAAELERLTQVLLEALDASGYIKPKTAAVTKEKLRRMVRRMKLAPADAETLLGMLRKVAWKLKSQK
ncbi:MAG TPA: RNA methyltransferase [Terriglobales bacterium]|nr:RNA methyltransferase [Terriglobales bacterium]